MSTEEFSSNVLQHNNNFVDVHFNVYNKISELNLSSPIILRNKYLINFREELTLLTPPPAVPEKRKSNMHNFNDVRKHQNIICPAILQCVREDVCLLSDVYIANNTYLS